MSAAAQQVIFYGDLNCPFCYAENERLIEAELYDRVEWRGIEHMPQLPIPWGQPDAEDQAALDEEVARLRQRAPEVAIVRPAQRSNSRPATWLIAEALALAPNKAAALRTEAFRALWRDGRDISHPAVLTELSLSVGLEPVEPSRDARRRAKIWTVEWQSDRFPRRIPIIATPEGQRLLGLADADAIRRFVDDPMQGGHGPDACRAD
jgi:predicted DsbA family dithiol-disulfide isomerase